MTIIDPTFDLAVGDVTTYRANLIAEAEALLTRSAGPLDGDDQTDFEALTAEVERVDADVAQRGLLERLATAGHTDEVRFEPHDFQIQKRTEPGWNSDTPGTRSQALAAVDQPADFYRDAVTDEVRERITVLLDNEDKTPVRYRNGLSSDGESPLANWVRVTSDPDYVSAVDAWVKDPEYARDLWSPAQRSAMVRARNWQMNHEERAMNEGTTAAGSALLPYFLDPAIMLTNNGVVSPLRDLATVSTIATNIWHGVTSAGVNAEWVGEAIEVADASPTFVQPTITTYKNDSYAQASIEVWQDSGISSEINGLLLEAKQRLEGTAFAVGTGTAQPRGIITATSGVGNQVAGSSGAAGAADLVAADVYAVANALAPRWRNGHTPAWLASFAVINKLRQLNTSTSQTSSAFWADFAAAAPSKLIGFPIYEVSDMDSTIVSGSTDDVLLFGDVSQYRIVDRVGSYLQFNPLVLGSNRRPSGEVGWVLWSRVGADTTHSGAFKLLRL